MIIPVQLMASSSQPWCIGWIPNVHSLLGERILCIDLLLILVLFQDLCGPFASKFKFTGSCSVSAEDSTSGYELPGNGGLYSVLPSFARLILRPNISVA